MEKVKVLIVEDELLVAEEMRLLLEDEGFLVHEVVDNATSARRALAMYKVDIILLDIKIKGEEDGVSLAGYVKDTYSIPMIFVTSLYDKQVTERALLTRPSAYLIKPYNREELAVAIRLALHNFEKNFLPSGLSDSPEKSHYMLNEHIFIKDKNRFEKVDYNDILWAKAESSYVSIATNVKNYLLTSDTLGSLMVKIDRPSIIRVHRSFSVNLEKVDAIDGHQLCLGGKKIPIGKNYRTMLKMHFNIL